MRRQKVPHIVTAVVTTILLSLALASAAWAVEYKVLYRFKGGLNDGAHPYAGLVVDPAGNLYGTTYEGGNCLYYGCGTVFKLSPNPDEKWTETVLHIFHWVDGANPWAGLTFDATGNLYGTTAVGGECGYGPGCGVVFKLTSNPDGSWTEGTIYSFEGGIDGATPYEGVITDSAANLYGTTATGGTYDHGKVFRLTPDPDGNWSESVVYNFSGPDGDCPVGRLVLDASGSLYGTTAYGGAYGYGTVFKLTPNPDGSWTEQVIASFRGQPGRYPWAGVIFDANGDLYGTTAGTGHNYGTVFKLSPNPDGTWKRTYLHVFNKTDGADPSADLIVDAAGNLYGVTRRGGAYDSGTVFKLAPEPDGRWKLVELHVFKNIQYPHAKLAMDPAGNLYGTAEQGGYGHGVVFRIKP